MPHPISLPITVDTQAPITINAQIAEQIKLLISIGELQPGDALPTVTQLAKHLGVNHNTIATVYNYLIESGYLVASRGKGTFVAHTQAVQNIITYKPFYNLLGEAFSAATIIELSPSEFGAAAYAQAVRLNRHQVPPLKLVFVECLQHSADVYEAIQSEIKLSLSKLHLEDLKTSQPKALKELLAANLVITTARHLWEVTKIATPEQEVIGVDIKPSLQLLTQISSLPRHALMLLVCQSEAGSSEMKQMLQQAGISHINFETLSQENIKQNPYLKLNFQSVPASAELRSYQFQTGLWHVPRQSPPGLQ
ncbi:GntR family transcriptional regulator [Scytonema hofmannii PCC 7110]|uniref:GntR family transcriptional regulator n=1 Tax=Scytonema hofmannii PCC 7110 TaxID=128403 RepID=A0A139WW86_9CYAN|nr:GntR family transcriptional regulator [Scytonema hofmannii]KYC36698.1 GntR family transcriptional regulator [Scytonema hofmannii PCC 7110]